MNGNRWRGLWRFVAYAVATLIPVVWLGLLLSLLPTNAVPHHRLVANAMRRAIPAGAATACGVAGIYAIVRAQRHLEISERTAALISALACGLVVLALA